MSNDMIATVRQILGAMFPPMFVGLVLLITIAFIGFISGAAIGYVISGGNEFVMWLCAGLGELLVLTHLLKQ